MTSTTTNTIGKVAALAAGFALVAMSFASFVAPVKADTTTTTTMTSSQIAALQAQIASLQAQLSAASGSSMSMSTTFNTDLTVGSTGSDVTALQNWLISKGFSISAGATGYFGAQTKAALAAYQASVGISPAVGYFGPITRAKVNASGSTTTTTTTTTTGGTTTTTGSSTTLSGGEGTINNFQTIGATNVTLGSGATQQVFGFQFQAGGSDLQVSRIYYDVSNPTATGTTRPWNVFKTAVLTDASGNTVATLDASNQNNYSEDGTVTSGAGAGNQIYRLDFENLNTIVKMNATQTYYLTLTTQSAYATGNVPATFNVGLAPQGLRATDAMGIQEYSTSNSAFSTVTLNSTTSGTVTISTGSDNPQTTTLMANQNNSTTGVVLNTFTIQNQGSAAVELYTLPVQLNTASTSVNGTTLQNSSTLVQSLMLYQGSTLLDTESPSSTFVSGGNITFKNLNFTIPAGTTSNFRIVATIQPVGGSNPAPSQAAATVSVNPLGAGAGIDVENTGGAIIPPTGSSTGYPISFAINGLSVASTPTTASATSAVTGNSGNTQTGTFTFVFNVTSFGQTIYVASTTNAFGITLVNSTTGTTSTSTAQLAANGVTSAITSSANRSAGGNFQVNSGQTATFTVTASKIGGGSFFYLILNTLTYGTSDLAPATATTTLPSTYTTNAVSINS